MSMFYVVVVAVVSWCWNVGVFQVSMRVASFTQQVS